MYSCDTFVCMPDVTAGNLLLFGKNSDRDRNEPMSVEYYPKQEHKKEDVVRITRRCIPQAGVTHASFIARPAWMWGAEIACNEHGVCGGNEALFCKTAPTSLDDNTITGMDVLRVCIERSKTAAEAKDVAITLIETYEQGGNCGFEEKFYYQNAFLIADATEAYHIETCGRSWVWKRIISGVYAISNAMRLTDDFDSCSADVKILREANGRYSWAAACSDPFITAAACGFGRRCRIESLLYNNSSIALESAIAVTRDHGVRRCGVSGGITGQDVCMHAGGGPIRKSQTTCSWVVSVARAPTGTSKTLVHTSMGAAPCLQIFRALAFPASGACASLAARPCPLLTYEADGARSYWWTLELLHRYALKHYEEWQPLLASCQAALEPTLLDHSRQFLQGTIDEAGFESVSKTHWRVCDAVVGVLLQYATGAILNRAEMLAMLEFVSAGKITNRAVAIPASITSDPVGSPVCVDPAPPGRATTLLFDLLDLLAPRFLYATAWAAANRAARLPM